MKSIIKNLLSVIAILLLLTPAYAATKHLSDQDIARVKAFKQLTKEVDQKTVPQVIAELEKTGYPQLNLILKEAMARAYVDIVQEQQVQGQKKKEWLYSMVALNMAYFQFGGDKDSAGGTKNLNKLIRSKLKQYLPADIFNQRGFRSSLG